MFGDEFKALSKPKYSHTIISLDVKCKRDKVSKYDKHNTLSMNRPE